MNITQLKELAKERSVIKTTGKSTPVVLILNDGIFIAKHGIKGMKYTSVPFNYENFYELANASERDVELFVEDNIIEERAIITTHNAIYIYHKGECKWQVKFYDSPTFLDWNYRHVLVAANLPKGDVTNGKSE